MNIQKDIIYYCKNSACCNNQISSRSALYRSGLCHSCSMKGKQNALKNGGKFYCVDCGVLIHHQATRCKNCYHKLRTQRLQIPENCSSYIDNRSNKQYYCKDCGKKITRCSGFYGLGFCGSCSQKGERSYNWQKGISKLPYSFDFTQKLKYKIRKRDNFTCQLCGIVEEKYLIIKGKVLTVHHIDYNKQNCEKENLITLCDKCNSKVNFNRNYWINYFEQRIKGDITWLI